MVARILKLALPFFKVMGPSILIGAILGAYPGYKAYEYTWIDSGFCTSCHIHDYANTSWKKSIHGSITTCHDCHHQPLVQYFDEAAALILKKPQFPVDMKHVPYVDKHLCESCHWDFGKAGHPHVAGPLQEHQLKDIPKVSNTRLHKLHLSKEVSMPYPKQQHLDEGFSKGDIAPKVKSANQASAESEAKGSHDSGSETFPKRSITCVDCHGGMANRAHNFSATDVSCVRCHKATHKVFDPTKVQTTFGCRNCHFIEFMVETETGPEAVKAEH